jgi:hypothetical protein
MSTIKPILFNTEMTLAVLENRKSQTRRLVTPTPPTDARLVMTPDKRHGWDESRELPGLGPDDRRVYYPRYYPGDILYVRETWAEWEGGYVFKADPVPAYPHSFVDRWYPSIHMPKEAARIFLRVTDVRVERLQNISRESAIAEGCSGAIPILEFKRIWNNTLKHMDHIRYGWAANPWVWAYCFERCEKPEELG